MDIKEKNIVAIREKGDYLYNCLKENEDYIQFINMSTEYKVDSVHSESSKDGNLIAYVARDNQIYRLNSSYYPRKEAEIWAKPYESSCYGRTNRIFYVFGLGNGYFISELIKIMDNDDRVLIYEPSKEMFFHSIEHYNLIDIIQNTRVTICINGINEEDLKEIIDVYGHGMQYGNNVYLSLPHYEKVYPEQRDWFNKIYTERFFDAFMDANTAKKYGKDWANASLDNLRTSMKSRFIGDYKNILNGEIPVIVVAAGPSLQKNVDMLKKAKGKAIILAVDTALNYLEKNNMIPDFIVTLDVHKPMYLFENEIAKKQPLFISMSGNPSVVEHNKGEKIFFDVFDILSNIKDVKSDYTPIKISGCVATMAFEIGRYLGAKTIILVGQDLAYSGDNTHAGGLTIGSSESKFALIEGNNGDKLWTRKDWYTFLMWYKREIASFDGIVINATEGGAKIDGTLVMTLEEAIEKYCNCHFDTEEFLNLVPNKEISDMELEKVLTKVRDEFYETERLAKEAIELCDYLIEENQTAKEESYVAKNKTKRLSDINKKLDALDLKNLTKQYTFDVTISEYQMIFDRFKEERENRLNVYTRAKKIYQSIEVAATEILSRI